MAVQQLQREDAQPDALLVLTFEPDWSAMRSSHSEREVFAYSVKSNSGNTYETELFISDLKTMCGYCSCPARVTCRHLKAALHELLQRKPDFGREANGH